MAGLPPRRNENKPIETANITNEQVDAAMYHVAKNWKKMNKDVRERVVQRLKGMKGDK